MCSLNVLYKAAGITKQAVQQHSRRTHERSSSMEELIARAQALRHAHPGCGVEKMYYQLQPTQMGRDRFIECLMDRGFRLKRPRMARRTTYRGPVRYPSLINGLRIDQPYQVWQSDITYIEVGASTYYAVFIIDVYTKKIIGYEVSAHLKAAANLRALQMALRKHPAPRIHHSDAGTQYSSKQYVAALQKNATQISMGGKATENAYAERINGTIKGEYLHYWKPRNLQHLKKCVQRAVHNYNQHRPHNHLKRKTPMQFENDCLTNSQFENPVITIFDHNNYSKPVNSI